MEDATTMEAGDSIGNSGIIYYVARSVILIGWPLALFFATVNFFPFELHNPLNHPNPVTYIVIWTVTGAIFGISSWRRKAKSS